MAKMFGAVNQRLMRRYGGPMTNQESTVTVGTAAVPLVGANPERVELIICNLGAADIIVAAAAQASLTAGILVRAGGGLLAFSVEEDGYMPALGWTAISSGAGNSVFVEEVVRVTEQIDVSQRSGA